MKNEKTFLTIEEKMQLAREGKPVPVCHRKNSLRNGFIVKVKGCIFDGYVSKKNIEL